MNKSDLRVQKLNERKNLDKEQVFQKSRLVCQNFINSELYKKSDFIMLYKSIGNEVCTGTLFESILGDKKRVAVPDTLKDGSILPVEVFADTEYKKGIYNIPEPIIRKPADKNEIDALIIPGVAFDRTGNRIGFGAGCYDKFLNGISAIKIGFCYDMQIIDHIDSEPFDIKMDYVISENGIIPTKR